MAIEVREKGGKGRKGGGGEGRKSEELRGTERERRDGEGSYRRGRGEKCGSFTG